MKLKFTKTTTGSENGYQVNTYSEGETYDIRDSRLAQHFIDSKVATKLADDAEPTKRIVNDVDGVNRGSLAPSELEKIKADEDAGVARPETDRMVEISEENQVDVKDEKALSAENYENKAKKTK